MAPSFPVRHIVEKDAMRKHGRMNMEEQSQRQPAREEDPRSPAASPVSIGGVKAVLAIVLVLGLAFLLMVFFLRFAR